LFVWFDSEGSIERFQLTYDKPYAEKAIDWKRGRGLVHMLVDDGANQGNYPGTPLLTMGGIFAKDRVIEYFREHAANIDSRVTAFVLQMLRELPHRPAGDREKTLAIVGALACGLLIAWRILR
jgi:hypothetical protein